MARPPGGPARAQTPSPRARSRAPAAPGPSPSSPPLKSWAPGSEGTSGALVNASRDQGLSLSPTGVPRLVPRFSVCTNSAGSAFPCEGHGGLAGLLRADSTCGRGPRRLCCPSRSGEGLGGRPVAPTAALTARGLRVHTWVGPGRPAPAVLVLLWGQRAQGAGAAGRAGLRWEGRLCLAVSSGSRGRLRQLRAHPPQAQGDFPACVPPLLVPRPWHCCPAPTAEAPAPPSLRALAGIRLLGGQAGPLLQLLDALGLGWPGPPSP